MQIANQKNTNVVEIQMIRLTMKAPVVTIMPGTVIISITIITINVTVILTIDVLLCTAWLCDANHSGLDDSSETVVDGIRRPCRRHSGNSKGNSGPHCLNTENLSCKP